jgi:bifunctional DNase/RNase
MQATVAGLIPHRVVLLKESDGQRALPIWVGPGEGDAIAVRLRNQELPRPLGVDLTTTLLDLGGVRVTQATVSRLHETVFYAMLSVETEEETAEVDCRPSDALSLAVRLNVPIYIASEVMDEAGVVPDDDGRYPIGRDPGPKVEWYSLLH